MASKKDVYTVTDSKFVQIIKNSKSYRECLIFLEITTYTNEIRNILKQRIKELNIDISHFKRTCSTKNFKYQLSDMLIENSPLKNKCSKSFISLLVDSGLKEYKCEMCGNKGFWNGKYLILQLHHKNGIHTDNRIENLELVCPNCHSQTATYGGKRNKGKVSNNKKISKIPVKNSASRKDSAPLKASPKKQINSNIPPKETLELLLQSKTVSDIAKQYNVSFNAVKKWIKKYNITYEPKLHKDLPIEIIDMYHSGQSIKQLATQLHIDNKRISKFLSDNGVVLRDENKRVIQKDKDGKIIKTWNSVREAGRSLNFKDESKIRACANGKRQSAYGFVWEWVK